MTSEATTNCSVHLPNCVIPIQREVRRRLESFGSAVLLRALDFRILISGAHVLLAEGLWLPGKPNFIRLEDAGRVFATSPSASEVSTDRADLAYAILNAPAAAALEGLGCEFLSIGQTTMGRALPTPPDWIFSGYPWRKSNNRFVGQIENLRMDVRDQSVPDEQMAQYGLDARIHVAMKYPRKKMYHGGYRVTGALPHGMSGGAVWHVGSTAALILTAIATTYDAGRHVMAGTRINPLLFRLRETLRADVS